MPQTMEEWTDLSNEYNNKWNFPNCIGALDGKHVILSSPIHSGSEFINYKGTLSIVMMALVDAEYCFSYVDIGCQGRISDGADDAFSLSQYLMKPYPGTHKKGSKERHYRLSRARRVVENVFGIMSSIFRVLRKPMLLNPQNATNIVMACSLLHNFLRKSRTSSSRYTPPGTFDSDNDGRIIPGTWRQDIDNVSSLLPLRNIPRKSGAQAKKIRETYAECFATVGKLPWQDAYA
nr:unnamed protein product [Callosobruchus analis]